MKFKSIVFCLFSIFFYSVATYAADNYLKIDYGISNHSSGVTQAKGSIAIDEADTGFILSGGSMIGDNWGIDLMFYDLGSSSFKVDAPTAGGGDPKLDMITLEGRTYAALQSGTVENKISGYGTGLVLASDNESSSGILNVNFFIKAGIHSWDKSGSSTKMYNDNAFKGSFYSQGVGAYGGFGVTSNFTESIALDLSYDIIGISKNVSLDDPSSLLSAGLRFSF